VKVTPMALEEVLLIEPVVHEDARGFLFETYASTRYVAAGVDASFVQINHSYSAKGVVRGLHYQVGRGQAKLVRVVRGEIIDVAVDVRRGSPCYGRWVSARLSAANRMQLYIPCGFAHGFCTLEPSEVIYMLSSPYDPTLERGIDYADPDLAIQWPVDHPLLSERDDSLPRLSSLAAENLPRYGLSDD